VEEVDAEVEFTIHADANALLDVLRFDHTNDFIILSRVYKSSVGQSLEGEQFIFEKSACLPPTTPRNCPANLQHFSELTTTLPFFLGTSAPVPAPRSPVSLTFQPDTHREKAPLSVHTFEKMPFENLVKSKKIFSFA
jgi:hypothetical protein